jgi:hypothetical protein
MAGKAPRELRRGTVQQIKRVNADSATCGGRVCVCVEIGRKGERNVRGEGVELFVSAQW